MAIDLPPPQTPLESTPEQVQQGSAYGSYEFQTYRIHLHGTPVLSAAAVQAALSGADTISNAVRALAQASYLAGYPAAQLSYALVGEDLYVLASPGKLDRVQAPNRLLPYFEGLNGADPLTARDFERRRMLASVHADRAGVDTQTSIVTEGEETVLTLKSARGPEPTVLRFEFGNPGNRFVGRYFGDLELRTATPEGDEFRLFWREGFRDLGDNPNNGQYHEQNLGWNRVTPWGIFGLSGRYVDYGFEFNAAPFSGEIAQVEGAWLYPVYADFNTRISAQAKLDYTDKTLEDVNGNTVQDQPYSSVELAATAARSFRWLGHRWDADAGLAVRQGLGDSDRALAFADLGYLLYRPSGRIKFHWNEQLNTSLEANAQLTSDTVPEQNQWVLGGAGSLSAYLPGVAVGDSGLLVRSVTEYRGLPEVYGLQLTPRGFVEFASTRLENGGVTQRAADIGAEVNVRVYSWLEAAVAYAEPLEKRNIPVAAQDAADANLYFRLNARF